MISLACPRVRVIGDINDLDSCNDLNPRLLDGLDIIDALTPVSKKTGLRENLL